MACARKNLAVESKSVRRRSSFSLPVSSPLPLASHPPIFLSLAHYCCACSARFYRILFFHSHFYTFSRFVVFTLSVVATRKKRVLPGAPFDQLSSFMAKGVFEICFFIGFPVNLPWTFDVRGALFLISCAVLILRAAHI